MHKVYMIFTTVFAIFTVFIIYSANTGSSIPAAHFLRSMDYGDKIAHFLLFGFLSFLLNLALASKRFEFGQISVYRGSILVGVVALMEELSQQFIPARAFEYYDLLADFGGIVFFGYITTLCVKRQNNCLANSRS